MKKFIIFLFLIINSFAYENQSNALIDIYSNSKNFLNKLEKIDHINSLKRALKGGYVEKDLVMKDIKYLIKDDLLNKEDIKILIELIEKLYLYKKEAIG